MSSDFYTSSILPYSGIIIKICRAYTDSQEDFEDYYQEVCLQIWRSKDKFRGDPKWSTWIYRISLNVCLSLLRKQKKQDVTNRFETSNNEISIQSDATEESKENDTNIIKLYDFTKNAVQVKPSGKQSHKTFLTLELVNNGSLIQYINMCGKFED